MKDSAPVTPERLATPVDVAEYLQVPVKTLAEWRSRGTGPRYSKVGHHVRYDWAHVREWVVSQQPAPATA